MSSPIRLLGALALALLPACAALAQAPPPRLALDVNVASWSLRGRTETAESMARRVATHLTPLLEADGWQVIRVRRGHVAAKSGRYHAVVRLDVDARPLLLVENAHLYRRDHRNTVVADSSASAQTWGRFKVSDGLSGNVLLHGDLPIVTPQVRPEGASSSLDDEEAVARVMADAALRAVTPGLDVTQVRR
jgi:hypothetical protein